MCYANHELEIFLTAVEMKCLCRFLFIILQVVHKKNSVFTDNITNVQHLFVQQIDLS